MNNVYLYWLLLIGVGAAVSLFVSVRVVIIFSIVCFGLAIATFLVASVQHDGSLQMYSGVALMMIPIAGALLGGGAILASVLREALAKRKKKLNSREAGPGG